MTFYVSSAKDGRIEVFQDGIKGKLLGSCDIPATGGPKQYKKVTCALTNESGTGNICLQLHSAPGESVSLDWFRFN